jgi:hypothetical protein
MMSETHNQRIRVGIALANATRAQWIELALASLNGLEVFLWNGKTGQSTRFDALVIDADQPGASFPGWYKEFVRTSPVPFLLVLGSPTSPLMMNIEWDEERTSFVPKPYQLEDLRDILLAKSRQWTRPEEDSGGAAPLRQPLGYLSSLPVSDLVQMLCLSHWSGRVIATELESRRVGQIYLSGGTLVHAETPELSGPEACIDLVGWGKCDFYFEEQHQPVVSTVFKPWQELLLEGARRFDEASLREASG